MSNFSKIVIIILIVLSFFFIKEKYGEEIQNMLTSIGAINKIELPKLLKEKEFEEIEPPQELPSENSEIKTETNQADIYFLALNSEDKGIYKKVTRSIPENEDKLDYSIKELLKGPNLVEKSTGAYSEIPKNTKLLGIQHKGNKIIINLSDEFQWGGGTDSIYSRMMQLIKTSINNSENKKIYLYIEGKQVNFLGGEGVMISQPLNEKSLEI